MFVKKALFLGLLLISTGVIAADAAECVQPGAPAIPSGRSSTESEMRDTMSAVKEFIAAGNYYRDCVDKQVRTLRAEDEENPLLLALVEAYQDSLDTEELLADTFNTQLRIFKSSHR